jgi:hypothetical protein
MQKYSNKSIRKHFLNYLLQKTYFLTKFGGFSTKTHFIFAISIYSDIRWLWSVGSHRRGIESTNLVKTETGILAHSAFSIAKKSSWFRGLRPLQRRSSSSQMCSIGLRSGLCEGQSNKRIFSSPLLLSQIGKCAWGHYLVEISIHDPCFSLHEVALCLE